MSAYYFDEAEEEHRLGRIVLIPIIIAAIVAIAATVFLTVTRGPMPLAI